MIENVIAVRNVTGGIEPPWTPGAPIDFDVSDAIWNSKLIQVDAEVGEQGVALWMRADGLKLYMGYTLFSGRQIYEYDLSTPWDVSTAVYKQFKHLGDVSSQNSLSGLSLSDDGLVVYSTASNGIIYRYPLTIAWDIVSMTAPNVIVSLGPIAGFDASALAGFGSNPVFSEDGLLLTLHWQKQDNQSFDRIGAVAVYQMTVPFNLTTLSLVYTWDEYNLDRDNGDCGTFSLDGWYFFVMYSDIPGTVVVKQYNLASAWNLTASVLFSQFTLAPTTGNATGLFVNLVPGVLLECDMGFNTSDPGYVRQWDV